MVFDAVDIDNDGKEEVIALYKGALVLYKFGEAGWSKAGNLDLNPAESVGVYDLRARVNGDGSVLVVYNLGNEPRKGIRNGLRAYLLSPVKKEKE
jgi:hypothetical protein